MSDKIHSPKRLLAEMARRELRGYRDNLVTEMAGLARATVRYELAHEEWVKSGKPTEAEVKNMYAAQQKNHNDIITDLKRRIETWEQALSFALDLLEQD